MRKTCPHPFFITLSAFLLLSFSFIGSTQPSIAKYSDEEVSEILYNIHTYYVDDLLIDERHFFDPNALLTQLDTYSKYLDQEELDSVFSAANGQYTGLGIEVEEIDGFVAIVGTLPGSPAEQAGLLAGDKLLYVNQDSVINKSIADVSKLLRKAKMDLINLKILRQESQLTLALRRQEISIQSVVSQLFPDGTGYLALSSFNHHTYHDVSRHITQLNTEFGDKITRLIIDLRDNPGGTLNSAVAISDLFLQHGTIVSTKGRFFDANQQFKAKQGDILYGAPIVVMINKNSASAAEILAAALKENQRALVVGMRSFGKGSVQSLIPLGNGTTALKLTTARYYTPLGQSIEGLGVEPHIMIPEQNLSEISKHAIINEKFASNVNPITTFAAHWGKAEVLSNQHQKQ